MSQLARHLHLHRVTRSFIRSAPSGRRVLSIRARLSAGGKGPAQVVHPGRCASGASPSIPGHLRRGDASRWRALERVSVLPGHSSIRVTEKHYAPWVRARQEQLELDVRRAWSTDLIASGEAKNGETTNAKRTVN